MSECKRCGWCCTVNIIPIIPGTIDTDTIELLVCRGISIVTIDGWPGEFMLEKAVCCHLEPTMLCSLHTCGLKPKKCREAECIQDKVSMVVPGR